MRGRAKGWNVSLMLKARPWDKQNQRPHYRLTETLEGKLTKSSYFAIWAFCSANRFMQGQTTLLLSRGHSFNYLFKEAVSDLLDARLRGTGTRQNISWDGMI